MLDGTYGLPRQVLTMALGGVRAPNPSRFSRSRSAREPARDPADAPLSPAGQDGSQGRGRRTNASDTGPR